MSLKRSCNAHKMLETNESSDDDKGGEDTKSESQIDYKEEWLSNFSQFMLANDTFKTDKLLLYFINFESYKHYYGIINENKYELFKQLVYEYQKLSCSDEKFTKLKEAVDSTMHSIYSQFNYFTMNLNRVKKG